VRELLRDATTSATIDHFSPAKEAEWPKAINMTLSFEEAMRLHLGLGQLPGKRNATKTPAGSKGILAGGRSGYNGVR